MSGRNQIKKPDFNEESSYLESDEVDYLYDDPLISEQPYVIISIYNPADMIQKRKNNLFKHYLSNLTETFDENKMVVDRDEEGDNAIEKTAQTHSNYRNRFHFLMEHLEWKRIEDSMEDFKIFKKGTNAVPNQVEIDRQFVEDNDDATCFLTIKNRGSAATAQGAVQRMRSIRNHDPDSPLYTAKNCCWMAWHPDMERMQNDQVGVLRELNEMMRIYYDKLDERDKKFEEYKNSNIEEAQEHRRRVLREQGKTDEEIIELEKKHKERLDELRDITSMKNKRYDEVMEQNRDMMAAQQALTGDKKQDVQQALEANKQGALTAPDIDEYEEPQEASYNTVNATETTTLLNDIL